MRKLYVPEGIGGSCLDVFLTVQLLSYLYGGGRRLDVFVRDAKLTSTFQPFRVRLDAHVKYSHAAEVWRALSQSNRESFLLSCHAITHQKYRIN